MPDFISPSGPEKAINFWLLARLLSALGLFAVAVLPWQPLRNFGMRWLGLLATLLLVALAAWVGLLHQDSLPRTFVSGQGLTLFKVVSEYVIIAMFVATALILRLRMRAEQSYDVVGLFAAASIMALSETYFTLYADVTDIFNVLGHVYKVIAYGFIYKSIFIDNVRAPYQRLRVAHDDLKLQVAKRERAEEMQKTSELNLQCCGRHHISQCAIQQDIWLHPAGYSEPGGLVATGLSGRAVSCCCPGKMEACH
jgi:hypothetical protein